MLSWQERHQGLIPQVSRRFLRLLSGLSPRRRSWLGTRYLALNPLPVPLESELVAEIQRCWEGDSLPIKRTALIDDARLLLLLEAVDARAAACAGPVATGRYLQVSSLRPLESLLDQNGSTMVLTPSFGAWQAIAPALARRGYRVGSLDLRPITRRPELVLPPGPGLDLVRLPSRGYARDLIRFAGQPRAVVVAIGDEGAGPRWARGSLLGRSAALGSTPFELARRQGMGILPVFALRENGLNRLLVERPIKPRNKGDAEADLDATASAWLKVVERMVRRYPAHYLAFLFTRFRQRTQDPVPLFGDEG